MSARLKDIAAHVGVSIKTVSNVVNGRDARVGPKTRRQVLEAIDALNYQPNAAARHLRNSRVGIIALAIPDLVNPYYADLGNAIVTAAAAHAYTVLLDHTRFDPVAEAQVIGGLRPQSIDGVILDPQALRMEDLRAHRAGVPVVLLGENLLDAPYDHVAIDNVAAAQAAAAHLLRLRRGRVAVIGIDPSKTDGSAHVRLQGYRAALAEAGRPVDPTLLVPGGAWRRSDGVRAMRHLLALDPPPDAVFCFNDLLALGAMWALQEAGCRIPDDVAVVGFDDLEDGRFATPSLTTIAPDKEEIGHLAVSLLLGRIDGTRTGPPEHVEAPFQLRARGSTLGSAGRVDAV